MTANPDGGDYVAMEVPCAGCNGSGSALVATGVLADLEARARRAEAERDEAVRAIEDADVAVAECHLALAKASQAVAEGRRNRDRWGTKFEEAAVAICDAVAERDSARAELAEVRRVVREFVAAEQQMFDLLAVVVPNSPLRPLWDALHRVAAEDVGSDGPNRRATGAESDLGGTVGAPRTRVVLSPVISSWRLGSTLTGVRSD